jgi:CRP/FNR family transcriptional regulator, cyclic AMP receptor protein
MTAAPPSSGIFAAAGPPPVAVLDADAGLQAVVGERAGRARNASLAAVLTLRTGSWNARDHSEVARGGFGLLVLDGVLLRRVGIEGRYGAELLARGDLLRPWQHDGEEGVIPFETTWRVVVATRVAILDLRWATRMAPFPEIAGELAGRCLERSLRLATIMAIVQQPRLDQRLWLLFWELADRYGKVHRDGVHIDLPLTHEVISHLAAARRPSVSAALSRLSARGILRRDGRYWVVTGDVPSLAPA